MQVFLDTNIFLYAVGACSTTGGSQSAGHGGAFVYSKPGNSSGGN